ncbi:unknown protein [Microcystis aeruginosa NIES-843]|uniref:Uncharacterized protein n=1 Tax=Microcystis aeruginosa (strain NIES-843 / IAM M-2473) TaxID=449447 RepID=B0JQN1_MICAN|nr:unknown protein [Microcystis aeruginosa NIES-843]
MPPIEPYQVTKNRHCSATIQNVGEIDRYAPKLVRYRRHWVAPPRWGWRACFRARYWVIGVFKISAISHQILC